MVRPFTEEPDIFQGASWAQVAADPEVLGYVRLSLEQPKGDLRRALLDPERIRDVLHTLPPAQLLALRTLIVLGGAARFDELRLQLDEAELGVEVEHLYRDLLDVGVLTGHTDGEPGAFIIRELGPVLAAELWPLGLPKRSEAPAPEAGDGSEALSAHQRLMLVVAGRLAQLPVKVTQVGRANKTSLKRFVKGSPLSVTEATRIVDELDDLELVESDGSHFYPLRDRILAHCGPRAGSALHQGLLELLAEQGPIPKAAAVDAVTFQARADRFAAWQLRTFLAEGGLSTPVFARIPEYVAETPGVRWQGDWMMPRGRPVDGDGFVTPAFDVMVGPCTPPEVVLTIATAASVRSIEQMVTFQLEPESVAGARVHGVDAGAILEALDRLCPHPVPDNVAHMVREWSAAARVARVRRVWVVEGPDDAPLGALGEQVAAGRVLAEGDYEEVVAAVREAGLRVAQPSTIREHRERRERVELGRLRAQARWAQRDTFFDDDRDDDFGDGEKLTWLAPCWYGDGADALLEARLTAAQRGERPWLEVGPEEDGPMTGGPAELLSLLQRLVEEAAPELRMAAKRFPPSERRRLDELLGPQSAEPHRFFMLSRKWRRRAVKQSRSVDELLARVDELWSPGRTSETGARLFAFAAAHMGERQGEPPTLERLQELAKTGAPLILNVGDVDPIVGTIASIQERRDGTWVLLDAPEDSGRGHSIALSSIERVVVLGPEPT